MAAPPPFGNTDFQGAMAALAPRGRVWRRDLASVFFQVLGALAPTYTRSSQAAVQLLADTLPTTTYNLLSEWESSLGLPDACTPPSQTITQRQAAVSAKWAARGGQTAAYFVSLAELLGFSITIEEFFPYTVDLPVDEPLWDEGAQFYWQVTAPDVTTFYFLVDAGCVDDPLETYDGTELTCRLTAAKPAHTTLVFVFS